MHRQRLVLLCRGTLYRAGCGKSPERSSRCSPCVSGFGMISRSSSSVKYSIFSCWCVFKACLIFLGMPGRQFCGRLTDFVIASSPHCTLPRTAPVAACPGSFSRLFMIPSVVELPPLGTCVHLLRCVLLILVPLVFSRSLLRTTTCVTSACSVHLSLCPS